MSTSHASAGVGQARTAPDDAAPVGGDGTAAPEGTGQTLPLAPASEAEESAEAHAVASVAAALPPDEPPARLPGSRWLRWRQQIAELAKFGAVGGLAYVVDVGIMNLLRFGPGEVLGHKPLTAKIISVCIATLVAWIGNRYWTFSEKRRSSRTRELVMFLLVNAGGMLIAVLTLAVSHYVLGFTSPLADNIAANGVGLVLGTAFRYLCYRYIVFTEEPEAAARV